MGYFVFVIGVVLALWGYVVDRKIMSVKVVFPSYWGGLGLLSGLRLYDLQEVNGSIFEIVLLGMCFFSVGSCISSGKYRIKRRIQFDYILNNKYLTYSFWCAIIFLVPLVLGVVALVASGVDFAIIRYRYMDQIYGSNLVMILYKFILFPLVFSYVAAFITDIIVNKSINVLFMIKMLLLIICEYVVTGDRYIMFFLMTSSILAVWFSKKSFSVKLKKIIKRLFILSIVFLAVVILIRGNSIFKSVYTYMVGCFNFFDYRMPYIGEKTYGVSSFQGILRPIMGLVERMGITWKVFEQATNFMMSLQNNVIYLDSRNSDMFNYFATCFIWFYKDGGLCGVGLLSALYGFVSNMSFKKMMNNQNVLNVGIYLFFFCSILLAMMEFAFVRSEFAWGLIFFVLFAIKRIPKAIDN